VTEIAAIDETIARLHSQKAASFGPARLTVLIVAGVLAIIGVTAIVLSRSSRTKPEKTALVDDGKNDDTPPAPATKAASGDLCRQRLTRLGKAVKSYTLIYSKKPGKLSDLYKENFITRVEDFACPASGSGLASEKEIDAKSDYTMEPLPGTSGVVVREKVPHHENGKLLAVMEDGTLREF
ncbi:MAG TPA: hypothetical protein VHM91_21500, partial [Verrucomicrobiales bacterium]|nr:hypothetical protein [Verrucomicrobiales bacterium]